MVEIFNSLLSNYKSKVRNPFFGTLASVWLFRNWSIVYAIFNFDKDCTLQDKINYIQGYFSHKEFGSELFHIVWVSFVVLLITYLLLAFSRALTDFYYKIIEPVIITKIDKTAVFTVSEKQQLERRINSLDAKLIKKEEEVSRYLTEIQKINVENEKIQGNLKKEIIDISVKYTSFQDKNSSYELTYNNLNEYFNQLKLTSNHIDALKLISKQKPNQVVMQSDSNIIYSHLINSGLVLNNGKYINLSILGNIYLNIYDELNLTSALV